MHFVLWAVKSVELTRVEPAAEQHLHILSCRAAVQPLLLQFILEPGNTLSQVQNHRIRNFRLVNIHANVRSSVL